MTDITTSIAKLKQHNEWRRGSVFTMLDPKEIGLAIDDVIKQAQLGGIALNTLRLISDRKRRTQEQRLAKSCILFIQSLEK